VPDVIVRQVRNKWVVSINPAVQPRARIHRMYAELFAQSAGASWALKAAARVRRRRCARCSRK
jgi:DNA-directed RNA polymerase specialized sigma54-like protein